MSQPQARTEVLDAVVDSFVTADAQDAKRRDIMNSLLGPDSSKKASTGDDLFSGASAPTPVTIAPASGTASDIKSATRESVSVHDVVPRESVPASSPSAATIATSEDDSATVTSEAKAADAPEVPEPEAKFVSAASPAAASEPSPAPAAAASPIVSSAALTSPIDPSSKPSAVAAAAVGQRPAPRAPRTAPAPEPASAPAPKQSFFNSFLEKMADFFDPGDTPQTAAETRAAAIAVQRKRQARQGRALGRVRTQALTAALLETFARLDLNKDGFVTKDEAWKHLLRCGHFRTAPLPNPPPPFEDVAEAAEGTAATAVAAAAGSDETETTAATAPSPRVRAVTISDDAWARIKDEYEDALSELPEFLLSHDDWVDTFGDIDVDNATLATMIESGRVYADLS